MKLIITSTETSVTLQRSQTAVFAKNKVDYELHPKRVSFRTSREDFAFIYANIQVNGVTLTKSNANELLSAALFRKASGDGGGGNFVPDWENKTQVMTGLGTWTATASGFIQRQANINNPTTPYAIFRIKINGILAWSTEYAGLLTTGLYELTSPHIAVKKGDVIVIESTGSNITNALYFIPPINLIDSNWEQKDF